MIEVHNLLFIIVSRLLHFGPATFLYLLVHMKICFLIERLFCVVSIVQDSALICVYSFSTDSTGGDGSNKIYRSLVETVCNAFPQAVWVISCLLYHHNEYIIDGNQPYTVPP
jgi:hypothetical protein